MEEIIELNSNGKHFPVYAAKPSGTIKGGLLVIHEVWGLADHIKKVANRFAQEGYIVLAPNLLSEINITAKLAGELQEELFDPERRSLAQPKLRKLMAPLQAPGFGERTLAKVQDCFKYLADQAGVNGRIGVTGFCFGGTYSFSLAVHEPNLKAAVPFYGHADFSQEQLRNINCPILAFYGEHDENLMSGLPELKNKMKTAGVNFTAQVYKNCGHAFFNDSNPYAYNENAAKDAWQKTIKFLSANLV
jgi:carboxymethylenebutenolidase